MRALVVNVVAGVAAATLLAAGVLLPKAAVAQGVPSYGQPAPTGDETIHGRIESIEGPYAIVVLDDRGFLDNVSLHAGTIINPRGLRLAPGMTVTIVGVNAGASLSAIEIDAPYGGAELGTGYGMYDYGTYAYPDYGFGAIYGLGEIFFASPPGVVYPGGSAVPPRPPVRGIEHPTPGHPDRKPLGGTQPATPHFAPTRSAPARSAPAPSSRSH